MFCTRQPVTTPGKKAKPTPQATNKPGTNVKIGTRAMRPHLIADRQQTQNASATVATSFAKAMEVRKAMADRSALTGASEDR